MTNLQKLWAPLPCVLRRESKLLYISFSWMDVVMSACVNYFSPNSASCWRQGTSPQVYNSENYNSLNAKIKCFSSTHLLKRRILFHIYKSLPLFAILDNFYKTDILFFFTLFWKRVFCLWAATLFGKIISPLTLGRFGRTLQQGKINKFNLLKSGWGLGNMAATGRVQPA